MVEGVIADTPAARLRHEDVIHDPASETQERAGSKLVDLPRRCGKERRYVSKIIDLPTRWGRRDELSLKWLRTSNQRGMRNRLKLNVATLVDTSRHPTIF